MIPELTDVRRALCARRRSTGLRLLRSKEGTKVDVQALAVSRCGARRYGEGNGQPSYLPGRQLIYPDNNVFYPDNNVSKS